MLGAVMTALCSLVYAHGVPSFVAHAQQSGFFRIGGDAHQPRFESHRVDGVGRNGGATVQTTRANGIGHGERNARVNGGGGNGNGKANGAGGPDRQVRGDYPYPGMYSVGIKQVSAETRSVPRPPENPNMVRAGSIRADVARYNEERSVPRNLARPPGDMSRPPEPSPYRN